MLETEGEIKKQNFKCKSKGFLKRTEKRVYVCMYICTHKYKHTCTCIYVCSVLWGIKLTNFQCMSNCSSHWDMT